MKDQEENASDRDSGGMSEGNRELAETGTMDVGYNAGSTDEMSGEAGVTGTGRTSGQLDETVTNTNDANRTPDRP